ncbi:hypothetical protein TNCV_3968201 [Trichonephila clavipes]|nr:hypothetical protein TNCV_3968201 [Trichonephila clavipes]
MLLRMVHCLTIAKQQVIYAKKGAEAGNVLRKHAGGRGRNSTPLENRYVAIVAKRNRNFTPSEIVANFATATSMHVSARVLSRQFNQVCLPVRCIPLQPCHRRERLRWHKEHVG